MKKTLLILSIITANLCSQTDSTFKFTLPELKISQLEKNKEVTYEFANERNIFLMSDSFLVANPDKYNYVVRIADIKKVAIRDGTHVWKTAAIIGGVGGVFGLLVGVGFHAVVNNIGGHSNGIIIPVFTIAGALAGGLIGALVGLSAPYYESFPQTEKDAGKKKEVLKKIFKSYNLSKRK
jgi:hypothetical protein